MNQKTRRILSIIFNLDQTFHNFSFGEMAKLWRDKPMKENMWKTTEGERICTAIRQWVREECRLRVFENRMLRRIFGPKRDEVTREWRKLHNEELNDLYFSSNIVRVIKSRRIRWAGHVARMGERRGIYRVLVGKPEGKWPFGRPRLRWEGNIKMDL